jgi:hypothetical protein
VVENQRKKKDGVLDVIEKLMEYETAGDPMTSLRWTRKTREKIANELSKSGIIIGKTTIGKILKKLEFSLKCNSKKISNGGKRLTSQERKARAEQFLYIAKMRKQFENRNFPIISADCKKKELVGSFKNPGTRLKRIADLVNDHDFITYAIGKAFPYGLFDERQKEGYVYVGQSPWDEKNKKFTSSETPEFAAENFARWWFDYGLKRYPTAKEILILVDAGGSNGYRSRMWKAKLYELLCVKYKLKVTICHYPPGASKWNPIEHRLFSEISKNWRGTPLDSFETVTKYIRSTKTKTGLKVRARLIKKRYEMGEKVSEDWFKMIGITRHNTFPEWNYTLQS